MGKGPEQTLLQGGHTETYEKMLSTTSLFHYVPLIYVAFFTNHMGKYIFQ